MKTKHLYYQRGVRKGTLRNNYRKRQNTEDFTADAREAVLRIWAKKGAKPITKRDVATEIGAGVSTLNYHVGCLSLLIKDAKAAALSNPRAYPIVVATLLATRDEDAMAAITDPEDYTFCMTELMNDIAPHLACFKV